MIKFGPSGEDDLFKIEGNTSILNMPKWLRERFNLDVYEFTFNHGINISDADALAFGKEAEKYEIEITAHAPYFINFGNPNEEFEQKSINYVLWSLKKLKLMGGKRLTLHLGSQGKLPREEVCLLIKNRLPLLVNALDANDYKDVEVCFEVMGKFSQIGNIVEVCEFAKMDARFNITVDFGHVNCLLQGGLKKEDDYENIIKLCFNRLGKEKAQKIHIHFSKIMFNEKGEVKHLTLEDDVFGPEFNPLIKVIKKYDLNTYVICESRGKMAQDAKKLKEMFKKI